MASLMCLFLFAAIQPLFARTVLVQSPTADDSSYEAAVKTIPQSIPVSLFMQEQLETRRSTHSLNKKLLLAQDQYLRGSIAKAQEVFSQISSLAFEEDWNTDERKIIFYSLLRSAQLTSDEEARSLWLRKAVHFQGALNLDKNIFPPPVLEKFQQEKNQAQRVKLATYVHSRYGDIYLLNGESVSASQVDDAYFYEENFRLTILSNKNQPRTIKMLRDFTDLPERPIGGILSSKSDEFLIFFNEEKIVPVGDQSKSLSIGYFLNNDANINFKPTTESSESSPLVPVSLQTTADSSSWSQRNWIYVGLGALIATAAIVKWSNDRKSRASAAPTPTHREDF